MPTRRRRTAFFGLFISYVTLFAGSSLAQVELKKNVQLDKHVCDQIIWSDADHLKRSIGIVPDHDGEKFWGGYIPWLSYTADGKVRICKETGGALGGFGHLTFHGAHPRGWANSKEDTQKIDCKPIFAGPNHVIYRASMDIMTTRGVVHGTVDYFIRTGRNDFVWAVTFDTHDTDGLVADSRAPYCEFDWEGDGKYSDAISGFGWATANKQFRTLDNQLTAKAKWDYTKDCPIPHIIEWKNKDVGDAEVGLIQTQTYAQQDAGAGNWHEMGKTGKGLPVNWNLTYQLNAYQGFATKKATWMLPYGGVGQENYTVFDGSRQASGKPFQSYALFCMFDKHTDVGVDADVAEMTTVQTQCKLTATIGTVADTTPGGAGRVDEIKCSPAGWNHVYGVWTVAGANNSVDCNLEIAEGSLVNPTFCFTNYNAPDVPPISLNDSAMKNDSDYFASVDTAGHRLFITFARRFAAGKNHITFVPSKSH